MNAAAILQQLQGTHLPLMHLDTVLSTPPSIGGWV